mmetsp:Transcript_48235/g.113863  ORF Transcript_48235/g.113863 Transcript_48235/m.113863 type:complete len:204 (-) Transcript_48235:515-1126(-)
MLSKSASSCRIASLPPPPSLPRRNSSSIACAAAFTRSFPAPLMRTACVPATPPWRSTLILTLNSPCSLCNVFPRGPTSTPTAPASPGGMGTVACCSLRCTATKLVWLDASECCSASRNARSCEMPPLGASTGEAEDSCENNQDGARCGLLPASSDSRIAARAARRCAAAPRTMLRSETGIVTRRGPSGDSAATVTLSGTSCAA